MAVCFYESPLGRIGIESDEVGLSALWFDDDNNKEQTVHDSDCAVLAAVRRWLDCYFAGDRPSIDIPLHIAGSDFHVEVMRLLLTVEYGKTMTYKELAEAIAAKRQVARMSAQAVGGALSRNKIAIIVPCHRVVGTNGSLVGYAGGIKRKAALLELEAKQKGVII